MSVNVFFYPNNKKLLISFILEIAVFTKGQRGSILLDYDNYKYVKNRRSTHRTYWICSKKDTLQCKARVVTGKDEKDHCISLNLAQAFHIPSESFIRCVPTSNSMHRTKSGLSNRKPKFLDARTFDNWGQIKYTTSPRGNKLLCYEGHRFIKNNIYGTNIYWKCTKWHNNCFRIDFIDSKKNGGKLLVINGFRFFRNKKRGSRQYWKCSNYYKEKCPAIAIYDETTLNLRLCHQHRHTTSNDIEIKPLISSSNNDIEMKPIISPKEELATLLNVDNRI
ncbi:uncharacterized protein LOC129915355 [Episyrphus balteatus]|uniref:uncharacterized protein LOC129915355 n=1 Tax=Episyrphus balteatus TaxID=286459 RepID=UPI0024859065|nr:uncharacterized protein LOC129915355 [Episyrphus balteatus]